MYPENIKFEGIVIGMTAHSQTITDYDVKSFAASQTITLFMQMMHMLKTLDLKKNVYGLTSVVFSRSI